MKTFYTGLEPAMVAVDTVAVFTNPMGLLCTKDSAGVVRCSASLNDIPDATPRYEAFDSNGGLALNNTYQIITMDSEVNSESVFSLSGGGIQVADARSYKYDYKVSGDSTDGDRATGRAAIFINGIELERTRSFAYFRSVANGEDTAKSSGVLNLSAGDIVDVRMLIFGDNVATEANASNLVLEVNT
jgi:hypothetical protein